MPLDTFICGTCMVSFNNIEQFILHKNELCGRTSVSEGSQNLETSMAVSSVTNLQQEEGISMEVTDEAGNVMSTATTLPGTETLLGNTADLFQGDNQQTVIIVQGNLPDLDLEGAGQILAEMTQQQHLSFKPVRMEQLGVQKKRGRPPGRGNKTTEKKKKKTETTQITNERKSPEINTDGRLTCTKCKKSFTKDRVFKAHKCIADSEYVDFTTKDIQNIDPDDNHMPQDDIEDSGAMDLDNDADFKLPSNVLHGIKSEGEVKIPKPTVIITSKTADEASEAVEGINEADNPAVDDGSDNVQPSNDEVVLQADHCGTVDDEPNKEQGNLGLVEVEANPDIEDPSRVERETDQIHSIPIFLNETEKLAFEASLNIDLSSVDHMFRIHCIEQELNQNASQLSRFSSNQLALYSCNTCDKVFKSLSHMRFHVLTHTDMKPFKCIKCNFTSNARGNLYTHMRKHTGQFYTCTKADNCRFRTVNKGHLVEHEKTHENNKHPCSLCNKNYKTLKSLMSHIRKYHDNQKGKDLLSTFMQGRDIRGSTVIHQCHVCNRKFKKKLDRDRHLFVHDIKDLPNVQHCDLCEYTASRPKYLENHFQKHRCIYRCYKCGEMFLSSVRLVEHLTSVHVDITDKSDTWEAMFEASINNSLYLPEPDEVVPQNERNLINLPPELSQTAVNQMGRLQNPGDEDFTNKLINAANEFINIVHTPGNTEDGSEDVSKGADGGENMDENAENHEIAEMNSNENAKTVNDNVETIKTADETVTCLEHMETTVDTNVTLESSEQTHPDETDTKVSDIQHLESNEDEHLMNPGDESLVDDDLDDTEDPTLVNPGVDNAVRETVRETDEVEDSSLDHTESMLEETDLTEEDLLGVKTKRVRAKQLIEKLGYLPMTLRIFQKMRDTFGSEECECCGRLFFSHVDYEPHVRTHTGDKPHVCQKCGFRAITRDNMRRHIENVHEHIQYPCKSCDFVATNRTQLWNHSMKHRSFKSLECPECQEMFETMKELKIHAVLVHPNSSQEELDKLTSVRHKLHGKLGRRSYKCPHCDKVFFRANSELQKHMWIHEGIKPFKCPICPHACRSKNNLQAHMLRHSKNKPFLCGDCGKAYKSKTALRWHVRAHIDGKIFKCDKCSYEATQRSHLKRHMETHTIIKRFACAYCDFSANTLGYLKIHCTRNHKDTISSLPAMGSAPVEISQTESNVYKCLSCDFVFGNLYDLKRHLKTRHHVNVQEIQKVEGHNSEEQQIVQLDDGTQPLETTTMEVVTDTTATQLQVSEEQDVAVNLVQQILDISQNGTYPQQLADGSIFHMNPETIIVQPDGSQMYITSDNGTTTTEIDGNQYVIQYVTPTDDIPVGEALNMVEVQTGEIETEVMAELHTEVISS